MLTRSAIKVLPRIYHWKDEIREVSCHLGDEECPIVIYMLYKTFLQTPGLGSREETSCLTFFKMGDEFILCSKKGNSHPTSTGIGKTQEKAFRVIIEVIFREAYVKKFCPREKLDEFSAVLMKILESA